MAAGPIADGEDTTAIRQNGRGALYANKECLGLTLKCRLKLLEGDPELDFGT
jgi:hypothetical protein